jgi:U3 small nucleolar RNA-associated protein 11
MSSLRNAVKRVTHKERAQPQDRAHLGLLEKKKDYKQRAKDFHFKTDLLTKMKQKAKMRNPDEFYFGMKNTKMLHGKHKKTLQAQNKERAELIGADAVRIMKDQDLSYIRMQKQKDSKKMERMQQNLHFLESDNRKRKHTVFVDNSEEAQDFDVAQHFETVPELAGRTFNRPRREDLAKQVLVDGADASTPKQRLLRKKTAQRLAKERAGAYGELEARAERVAKLSRAEAHIVTEKLVAGKGRKRKIKAAEDGEPAQYKWRRKRLR